MKKSKFFDFFKQSWLLLLALALVVASCKDDDDDVKPPPVIILDGMYVKGAGTALTDFNSKGILKITRNEVNQEDRAQLREIYVAVKGGTQGFNIVEVAGATQTMYGPGPDFGVVGDADRNVNEPKLDFWRGSFVQSTTPFTVPDDGLYHVALDTELGIIVIVPVQYWGLIGAATPGGWTDDTKMMPGAFNLNTMTFEVQDVVMTVSNWKFRYSGGWKVFIDPDFDLGGGDVGVIVNSNFGGAVNALVSGGDDIANAEAGLYTATMVWKLGEAYTATLTKTGDVVLPEYPDAMYLVGAATFYDWHTPGEKEDALMHKIAGGGGNDGVFWKIAHLEGGMGFKLSAENWSNPNIGFNDVDEFDAEGIAVLADGGDMKVEVSKMYMIVLDLRNDMIKMSVKEASVYGIGAAFGGWSEPASPFTVNHAAKTIVSPALTSGTIRMYADHSWIPDWWNAEFVVVDDEIFYRNDSNDDPPVVEGTAGQVITLYFDDNTGSID